MQTGLCLQQRVVPSVKVTVIACNLKNYGGMLRKQTDGVLIKRIL
jgi:hypothetical protein